MATERIVPIDPLGFIKKCIAQGRVYWTYHVNMHLIYFMHGEDVYHVLIAADVAGENVRVVTAYRPDPREWSEDLKVRRIP